LTPEVFDLYFLQPSPESELSRHNTSARVLHGFRRISSLIVLNLPLPPAS
jgi:hypothetical protein